MKLIQYTLLGFMFASGFGNVANAQQRGGARGEQRKETPRPQQEVRQNTQHQERGQQRNERPMTGVHQRTERVNPNRNRGEIAKNSSTIGHTNTHGTIDNRKDHHVNRPEPIRINNSNNRTKYSYSKPINNFDQRQYDRYKHNNINFYGRNGIYYRNWNNNYVRFMPPVGFRVNVLPHGYVKLYSGNSAYYFFEGIYYQRYNSSYYVA